MPSRFDYLIPASYRPKKKFMELAVAEGKRAGDRGDYPIGAVIARLTEGHEVIIASAGNRVKTSGSSIKHVELETLKYVSSGYGRHPRRAGVSKIQFSVEYESVSREPLEPDRELARNKVRTSRCAECRAIKISPTVVAIVR